LGFEHITVLKDELVQGLQLKPGDIAVDCTAGGGGHTAGLLEAVGAEGKVIAFDRDQMAVDHLQRRFTAEIACGRLRVEWARFSELGSTLKNLGLEGKIAGVAADIGVSSPQIDVADRGFSFSNDGPLDMRMNKSGTDQSAAEYLATASVQELTKVFRDYGEEPKAKFVAEAIVRTREQSPLTSTTQLAKLVDESIHYRERSRKHPATKIFQALRIVVNDELGELERLLNSGFECLKSGGRLGIISFHSLEDRLVKRRFLDLTGRREEAGLPREVPLTEEQVRVVRNAKGTIIKPFPLVPSDEEINKNPRSRSAKLRVIEKI